MGTRVRLLGELATRWHNTTTTEARTAVAIAGGMAASSLVGGVRVGMHAGTEIDPGRLYVKPDTPGTDMVVVPLSMCLGPVMGAAFFVAAVPCTVIVGCAWVGLRVGNALRDD